MDVSEIQLAIELDHFAAPEPTKSLQPFTERHRPKLLVAHDPKSRVGRVPTKELRLERLERDVTKVHGLYPMMGERAAVHRRGPGRKHLLQARAAVLADARSSPERTGKSRMRRTLLGLFRVARRSTGAVASRVGPKPDWEAT